MLSRSILLSSLSNSDHHLPRKAVFMDRDGVLIDDVHYISDPKDVFVLEGAFEFLSLMKSQGYLLIIVTNQSGISRGISTWAQYYSVNDEMVKQLRFFDFDLILANSELTITDYESDWRKPAVGMFKSACQLYNIDLDRSLMIGDRLSDLKAGFMSGIMTLIHVETGHGLKERPLVNAFERSETFINSGAMLCYTKSINTFSFANII